MRSEAMEKEKERQDKRDAMFEEAKAKFDEGVQTEIEAKK
jgi:hypothetical protein